MIKSTDDHNLDDSTDFLVCLVTSDPNEPEPETIAQAQRSHDWLEWKQGIINEITAVLQNKVLVPDSKPRHKPIRSKLAFKRKRDHNGKVVKHKARFCPKGCQQIHGVNFYETYAPVASMDTTRTVLAVATAKDYDVEQMDVDNAFTLSKLKEDVWIIISKDVMSIPEVAQLFADEFGLEYNSIFGKELIAKLLRAIYGLKQSNRTFSEMLDSWLVKDQQFERSAADTCLYRLKNNPLWILIYVDDILIVGPTAKVQDFKKIISMKFSMKDLGPVHWYLGMEITRDRHTKRMHASQSRYLKNVLDRFQMSDCNVKRSPFSSGTTLERSKEETTEYPYRQLVGCLLYAAKGTRPDIAHAIGILTQHLVSPTDLHVNAAKHVLKYIKGTIDHCITYHCRNSQQQPVLAGWVDSDWGGDIETRKSTTGLVVQLCNGPVAFSSMLQQTIALSSAVAEYIAACSIAERVVFLRQLLEFLDTIQTKPTNLNEDNQACIKIATNPMTTKRTRHLEIRYHYVREQVQRGVIAFTWVKSEDQIADVLTKADISNAQRMRLNDQLLGMVVDTSGEEECKNVTPEG